MKQSHMANGLEGENSVKSCHFRCLLIEFLLSLCYNQQNEEQLCNKCVAESTTTNICEHLTKIICFFLQR